MTAAARALIVCLSTVGAAGAASSPSGVRHAVRYLMGTWCDLSLLDGAPDDGAAEAAFRTISRLEHILSNWDPTSELSLVNASAGREPQPVSRDLAEVVREAIELCALTDGAFDPTAGSLVHAWGFDTELPSAPSPERQREAASRVGCDHVAVRFDPPSIALVDHARLDLGGIGKGYAVDGALAVLRASRG